MNAAEVTRDNTGPYWRTVKAIVEVLAENHPTGLSAPELADRTPYSRSAVRNGLAVAAAAEMIRSTPGHRRPVRGPAPAVWHLNQAPAGQP